MSSRITQRPLFWGRRIRSFLLGEREPQHDRRSASRSIVGGRKQNEDRYYSSDQDQFYMVADGMGGYKGGSLASQIAIETIPELMRDLVMCGVRSDRMLDHAFRSAVQTACDEMSIVAQHHPEYGRMGCTMAAAFAIGDTMYYTNVGDCRVYLLRGRSLKQLTRDESIVQGLIDSKVITESQSRTNKLRHMVTNSVSAHGVQTPPRLKKSKIRANDAVLITSDGLINELSDREISTVLNDAKTPRSAVNQLISIATARCASDNVTCVVFEPQQERQFSEITNSGLEAQTC